MITCPKCNSSAISSLANVVVFANIDVNSGQIVDILDHDQAKPENLTCAACNYEWSVDE